MMCQHRKKAMNIHPREERIDPLLLATNRSVGSGSGIIEVVVSSLGSGAPQDMELA